MLGLRILILLASLVVASPSWSQLNLPPLTNPRIIPSPVRAGEPVVVRFHVNACSAWFPGAEQITVQDSVITLTHQVDSICGVPPPDYEHDFVLGVFQPGTYTFVYAPTWSTGEPYLPQSIQFGVFAVSIPAGSWWAASALGLALLLLGSRHLTMRSSRPPGKFCISTKRCWPAAA
jgi:hypothetical protein